MAIPEWPADLPCPIREGFSRKPKAPFVGTEMDDGTEFRRRRFRVFPITISASFILTRAQYEKYSAFCQDDINGYTDWFMVLVDGPDGIARKRCKWAEPPDEDGSIGGGYWKVSGQLITHSNF